MQVVFPMTNRLKKVLKFASHPVTDQAFFLLYKVGAIAPWYLLGMDIMNRFDGAV